MMSVSKFEVLTGKEEMKIIVGTHFSLFLIASCLFLWKFHSILKVQGTSNFLKRINY